MRFSISLISPNSIAREGLARIVQSDGIDVSSSYSSLLDIDWAEVPPNEMFVIDLPLPTEQIACVETLCGQTSGLKSVILADNFDYQTMSSCFRNGAHGYIIKSMPCSALVASLRLAALGHKVMPSDLADILPQEPLLIGEAVTDHDAANNDSNLSRRENDVLCCLMAGYPNKVIARKLDLSEATVKVHVKAILRKLNVVNRTQAAIWATTHGVNGSPAAVM